MMNSVFRFSSSLINDEIIQSYAGSQNEKLELKQIIDESNRRVCVTDLCNKWKKSKPDFLII